MGKLALPFVSCSVAWRRERYHFTPLPLITCNRWETCPWGHKSKRAIPVPRQRQHLGEPALHHIWAASRVESGCGGCGLAMPPRGPNCGRTGSASCLLCVGVVIVQEAFHFSPFWPCHQQWIGELAPWNHRSRRAGLAPHMLQHLGEQALYHI